MPPRPLPLAGPLFVAALGAGLLGACSGGGDAPLPTVASVTAERVVEDGEAQRASILKVRFAAKFTIVEERLPLASLFAVETPDPADVESDERRTVLVQSAEHSGESRVITLQVNALVPDGSTLKISQRAFKAKATGTIDVEIDADLDRVQVALASTSFAIAEPSLLDRDRTLPVIAGDRDPGAMETALVDHLIARSEPDEVIDVAVQRYRAIPVAVVPSAKLRAALAALTNTFADEALAAFLTPGNCTGKPARRIAFEVPPDYPQLYARVTFASDGARIVSINPNLEGEPIEKLMPVLAHEAIHCDDEDPITEEVAATAIDTFLYLHLIPVNPAMVLDGTPLTREYNVDVVAMLNSGRRFPETGGILPSAGVKEAIPGTTSPVSSFAELIGRAYQDFPTGRPPDEQAMQAYVEVIARAANMPAKSGFDLVYLDELLSRALDPRVMLVVVQALGLEAVPIE
ncbi:MAG: hypothetical protein ACKVVT_12090 [Dehalococcoidia bacterium]